MTKTTTIHSDNHILLGQKEKQYDLDKHPAAINMLMHIATMFLSSVEETVMCTT